MPCTWQPLVSQTSTRWAANATPSYNLPSTNEGSPSWYWASRAARSIIVQPRAVNCHGAGLQIVPEAHSRPSCDPIDYVLLFLYGTDGFNLDIPKDSKAKSVTAMEYYLLLATYAEWRPALNVLLCGDRLFQRYVDDTCTIMEQQRLNYLRFNQNSLRVLTLFWRMTDILRVGGRGKEGDRAGATTNAHR